MGKNNIPYNTYTFTYKSQSIHGDKISYILVDYVNFETKVQLICNICNYNFWQRPASHLKGIGCPECGKTKNSNAVVEFFKKSKDTRWNNYLVNFLKTHGNKYDYSKSMFINGSTKIEIFCNTCKSYFWQSPASHMTGCGCKTCACNNARKTKEQFILDSFPLYGSKDTYEKVEYKSNKLPVIITCVEHGDYPRRPDHYLQGSRCPKCVMSSGESSILDILLNNRIQFETQWHFNKHKQLRGKGKMYMSFDFYLPNYNLCIEYDGKQHFEPIEHMGGMKAFIELQHRDLLKNLFCLQNNVRLVRIPYWELLTEELILFYVYENFTVVTSTTRS